MHGNALTIHTLPQLQAMTNVEQAENVHQVFETLKRLWAHACPNRPELGKYIRQIHKDWLPCLENARVAQFPTTRPASDFFHLLESNKPEGPEEPTYPKNRKT